MEHTYKIPVEPKKKIIMRKKTNIEEEFFGGLYTTTDEGRFSTWLMRGREESTPIKTDLQTLAKLWFNAEPTKEQVEDFRSMVQTLNTIGIEMQFEKYLSTIFPAQWMETMREADTGTTTIQLSIDRGFLLRLVKLGTFLLSIPTDTKL